MIENIIEKYNINIDHALQVKSYALMLFDAINTLTNEFSEKDKEYLKAAALLHDIGYCVDKKSHHKHSLTLIKQLEIPEYSEYEKLLIGNIARYHRCALPNVEKHEDYAALEENDRIKVSKLAAILKIADGLDKPHKNLILGISADVNEDCIVFHFKTLGFTPKFEMAVEKSDLMKQIYNRDVKFSCE